MAFLEASSMSDRLDSAFKSAITSGAAINDPVTGALLERAVQRKKLRELQSAHGVTAAEILAELPIDLAKALENVAELERTPEELKKLEEMRKKREEERQKALESQEALEAAADEDAPTREVTAEEQAAIDAFMNRAKLEAEAQQAEDERVKAEREKARKAREEGKDEEKGEGEGEDEGGGYSLPEPTVKRIAPLFQNSALFAHFIIAISGDKTREKHPEMRADNDIWKNPVAIRELKQTAASILRHIGFIFQHRSNTNFHQKTPFYWGFCTFLGATNWDRTSNLRLRRPTLYPIEL